MMRIELDLRARIIKHLKPIKGIHAIPVENTVCAGTPDINLRNAMCGEYWIELKIVEKYPKRPDTSLKISHFTDIQKLWMRQRIAIGGNVFIIVQVEEDYYLFQATEEVISNLGKTWNASEWKSNCQMISQNWATVLRRFL